MITSSCQGHRPASWDAAVASRAAAQAGTAAPSEHRHGDDDHVEHTRCAGRGPSLVSAMTEALRSLLPSDAKPAQSPAAEDGARAFAHALVDALHEQRSGHRHGRHGGHHGYDDLAQRLERLAGSLAQAAPAGDGGNGTTHLSASLTTATLDLSIDANGASASLSFSSVTLDVSQQTGNSAAATPAAADSPLLGAFRRLMTALQPDAAAADAASDGSRLSAFLRQLAGALRSGASAAEPATRGGLVSLAA